MNGYKCFYGGKTLDVYAETQLQARDKAAAQFKAKKSYEVTAVLCEKDTDGSNSLATLACRVALLSAQMYLEQHELVATPEALEACVKSWVKLKLPEALNDAKEALACGMGQAAEATFRASMSLAGIEAAKEAGQPASV